MPFLIESSLHMISPHCYLCKTWSTLASPDNTSRKMKFSQAHSAVSRLRTNVISVVIRPRFSLVPCTQSVTPQRHISPPDYSTLRCQWVTVTTPDLLLSQDSQSGKGCGSVSLPLINPHAPPSTPLLTLTSAGTGHATKISPAFDRLASKLEQEAAESDTNLTQEFCWNLFVSAVYIPAIWDKSAQGRFVFLKSV